MNYQCFLILPVWGEEDRNPTGWEPHRSIIGWTRTDTNEFQKSKESFGVGAMWFAYWLPKNWTWDNETEPHLHVRCPNPDETSHRDWDIDSRCSNCGLPEDKVHRCWVRSGLPPIITVSKVPGPSCNAGAGSIALPHWHGMLENGILRPC